MSDIERFERHFKRGEGCWNWTGGTNRQGYGQFGFGRRPDGRGYNTWIASRMAYTFYVGPIPEDKFVLHSCNNPSCVNPEHLYLGTHQENMRDRALAGTAYRAFGEKHHRAALTQEQADAIRKFKAETGKSQRTIAFKFKVSRALVGLVLSGKRY